MSDRSKPLLVSADGYELCYECDGERICWSCGGTRLRRNGDRCGQCVGRGLCIVCNGDGELILGTEAEVDGIPKSVLAAHPEVVDAHRALEEHRNGHTITATCRTCGAVLEVTAVEATGATVVTCASGHVIYRSKHAPG